jgi:hypothetical protein
MATQVTAAAIRAHLEGELPAVLWRWENERQDAPEPYDGGGAAVSWALVEFTGDSLDQESIGAGERISNRWVERGVVFIHVFAPTGAGSAPARTLAGQISDVFRAVSELAPAITFERISIGLGDTDSPDGAWWRLPMTVAWKREL